MDQFNITRDSLPQAVSSVLRICESQLAQADHDATNFALIRDLRVAVDALRLIDSEIHGGAQRPKGQRSAMFARYAIDEEERIVMDSELKEAIVRIEDLHARS
jgi:hypothetical protein